MHKVGIEIEFVGSMSRLIGEIHGLGISVNDGSRSHEGWDEHSWRVKRDGSVTNGGELVSPPLDFDDPTQRGQVDLAVKALQLAGCRPDPSAGIHVHVDATDLNAHQIAAVARFFYKFEDVIYRLASSGWRRIRANGIGQYCKPISYEETPPSSYGEHNPSIKALCRVRDLEGFYKAWYGGIVTGEQARTDHHHGSRYHGLNLHAWNFQKTVEFRVFNSSINPQRIQAYLALCVGIVQDARNGFSRSTGKAYRLGGMEAGVTSEKAAWIRFQQVMTTDSKDTKRVVSREDWKLILRCWNDARPQINPMNWPFVA